MCVVVASVFPSPLPNNSTYPPPRQIGFFRELSGAVNLHSSYTVFTHNFFKSQVLGECLEYQQGLMSINGGRYLVIPFKKDTTLTEIGGLICVNNV